MATTLSDDVYQIQNVHYTKSFIGLQYHDIIVAGRYQTQVDDPHIKWTVKVDETGYGMTISSGDRYIGAVSKKVVLDNEAYKWELSPREVGRWFISDPASGLGLYLPNGNDGTEVGLGGEDAGDMGFWYFVSPSTE